jgi:cell division protein FtsW
MYQFKAERSPRFAGGNHLLVAVILLLTGIGLVTLYSSSYAFASLFFRDGGLHFVNQQLRACAVGIVLFFLASRMNLDRIRGGLLFLVLLSIISCILTFVPGIGDTRNGASRWISLPGGQTIQPSEFAKLVLPLYLAHFFDKKKEGIGNIFTGVLPPVLITAAFFIIIYLQNNFSTAVFIAGNAVIIFFLAGFRLRYFVSAIMMLVPLSGLLILTKEHRLRRLISFIRPEWEPQGAGYQVGSSIKAIVSGGFFGKGLGQGTKKIASIPEVQSDFIFSAFSEESGFFGVVFVFLLFGVFAFLGYRGAVRASGTFRRLLVCGLVTTIISQVMVNIAVVAGFLPATGIPLPFFSAGGSSLAATLPMAGFIVNVCRRQEDHGFRDFSSVGAGEASHVR